MNEDTYDAVTRVARTFRAYRQMLDPEHPNKDVGDRLYREWPDLWGHLDTLQREWPE